MISKFISFFDADSADDGDPDSADDKIDADWANDDGDADWADDDKSDAASADETLPHTEPSL